MTFLGALCGFAREIVVGTGRSAALGAMVAAGLVLKPKLVAMLTREFPRIGVGEVDCARSPALAAAYSVFTVPSLIVFTEGKESLRKSRSFGLAALVAELERPYSLLY